ncbi:MAG: hypothetical protein ACYSWU_27820, partial [Planctomycetota bacterium]
MSADKQSLLTSTWIGWTRNHRLLASALGHLGLFVLSWSCAFALVYKTRLTNIPAWFPNFFLPVLPLVLAIKLLLFGMMGLYRGSWRYVSMRDVSRVTKASFISFVWILVFVYGLINADVIAHLIGIE